MAGTLPSTRGLSASPLSAAYRTRVEERLGGPLEVAVVSEMRGAGALGILRRLVRIRAERGYLLLEHPSALSLLPVLQLLLGLTRCRRLAAVGPGCEVAGFTRAHAAAQAVRLAWSSLRGALATAACAAELLVLNRQGRREVPVRAVRRIAYLRTNLWFGVRAGGSIGHVAGVLNALARQCERVEVLSLERPPLLDPRIAVQTILFPGPLGTPHELNYYRYQRHFAREGRRALGPSRPDLLYHRVSLASYAGARLARDLGVPLVVEYNGSEVWVSRHWGFALLFPGLARLAEDVALRHADLVVTVSEVLRDELEARGIPAARILVHPNCVDPERFDPGRFPDEARRALRARYGIAASAVVCGFIGTFGRWHGITLLAETIRELAERDESWLQDRQVHFLLVGDGVLMSRVRETLAAPRVARYVTFTGLVEQHEAPAHLAAADVLLSPHVPNPDGTRFFGSPTKLFEYMAMAKGIVASDLDQIGDVLRHGYRAADLPAGPCRADESRLAVLTTPGIAAELVAGIRFLVERPDYREALGRNARREALSRYTWEHNVEDLLRRLAVTGGDARGEALAPRSSGGRVPGDMP
jgi:glycosyltransferase involved in cell wall biosynthesis